MAQILRPNSTNVSTGWTAIGAATHHECIDDVTADENSTRVEMTSGSTSLQCGLDSGVDPVSSTDHTIFVRARSVSGAALAISLVEGASTVRANFFVPSVSSLSWTDYTYTLSSSEADSITDYSDLNLWFATFPSSTGIRVTQTYFSIPDAGSTEDISASTSFELISSQMLKGVGGIGSSLPFEMLASQAIGGDGRLNPGSLQLALSQIADLIDTPSGGPAIKVERFDVDVSSNGQTYTLSNDVGNIEKAFVRVVGASDSASAGPTGSTGNAPPDQVSCAVQVTGTNELTFYGPGSMSSRKMIGEVWRYVGSGGGSAEFEVKERGSVTIASGVSSGSVSLTGITDRNKCVPLHCGYITANASVSDYEQATVALHIDSSGNLVASRNNTGLNSITVYYEVVEFTGADWDVGHGISSNHDTNGTFNTGGEVVTMNTDSTGSGGSTFDVSDWETAMILQGTMEGDTAETGLSDCLMYFSPGTGTTSVRCTLDNTNSRNDGDAYFHVIKHADMIVKRDSNSNVIEGNGSYGTALSMPSGVNGSTPLDELSLEWYPGTNGEGTAHARGRLHAKIADNSGYEIQHWVHRSGNTVKANYGVADLSAILSGGAPSSDISAALSFNLSQLAAIAGVGELEGVLNTVISQSVQAKGTGGLAINADVALDVASQIQAIASIQSALDVSVSLASQIAALANIGSALGVEISSAQSLKGIANLAMTGQLTHSLAAQLVAIADLQAALDLSFSVAADIASQVSLSASLGIDLTTSASINAIGEMAASGSISLDLAGTLAAIGKVQSALSIEFTSASVIVATASSSVSMAIELSQSSDVNGIGSLQANLPSELITAIDINGVGTMAIATQVVVDQASHLSGIIQGSSSILFSLLSSADLKGAGSLGSAPSFQLTQDADIKGIGSVSFTGDVVFTIVARPDGSSDLSSQLGIDFAQSSNVKGIGSLQAALQAIVNHSVNLKGIGSTASSLVAEMALAARLGSPTDIGATIAVGLSQDAILKGIGATGATTTIALYNQVDATAIAPIASQVEIAIEKASRVIGAAQSSCQVDISISQDSNLKGIAQVRGNFSFVCLMEADLKGSALLSSSPAISIEQVSSLTAVQQIAAALQLELSQNASLGSVAYITASLPIAYQVITDINGVGRMDAVASLDLLLDARGILRGTDVMVKELISKVQTMLVEDSSICTDYNGISSVQTQITDNSCVTYNVDLESHVTTEITFNS